MEYILAPWREKYVKKASKMTECIFCRKDKSKSDKEKFILVRGRYNFIVLNKYPYTPGHLMIAPFKHLDSIEKADKKTSYEMSDFLQLSLKILRKVYDPHGFNTGMNMGRSAGAGVADHYHLHVIPRWVGDSNYMPLVGGTKVVIEDLNTTYDKLFPFFAKEKLQP